MSLEKKVAQKLIKTHKNLSLAESCTGGLLSHRLTNIPGSSNFLKVGLIVYSNDAKVKLLKIPQKILKTYGAVSCECALAMAKNLRKIYKTDIGLAVTGIAGPSGATATKPVGLVYIATSTPENTRCHQYRLKGSRLHIKSQAATKALHLLLNLASRNSR